MKTTNQHKKYWKDRKIDWKTSYLDTWNHPHRKLIIAALRGFHWVSLMEVGVGGGANLYNILKNFKGKQIGGIDVNKDAIELAQKTFNGGLFKVNSADDIMLSDNSTDVMLSDMTLIYVSPLQIMSYLKEIKRVARNYIVLCEFHSDSWWNRLALKINTGYNAHNYRKLLTKLGFYDIFTYKLKEEDWPGGNPQKTFAYLIIAKVPKR